MRYAVARQPIKQREERPSSDYPEARRRKTMSTSGELNRVHPVSCLRLRCNAAVVLLL